MQSNRFPDLFEAEWREDEWTTRRRPSPPQLQRPLLITEDGEFAYIKDEFTVYVGETDPNAIQGMGKGIIFRKKGSAR
jgi:hypothetical protein